MYCIIGFVTGRLLFDGHWVLAITLLVSVALDIKKHYESDKEKEMLKKECKALLKQHKGISNEK